MVCITGTLEGNVKEKRGGSKKGKKKKKKKKERKKIKNISF